MMAITGNKGEWSETYAFFKVLADGKLYPGDANLNKIPNFYYPVISVLRTEHGRNKSFAVHSSNIVISDGVNPNVIISTSQFVSQSLTLLNAIKSGSGSFSVNATELFLKQLGSHSIKAKSSSKADIIINIHDPRTNLQPILGFSIKSKLGKASTLLNASAATNFTFKVKGYKLSPSEINQINTINTTSKIRDRINFLYSKSCYLELDEFDNGIFKNNLVLIDSLMPEILGSALVSFYKNAIVKLSDILADLNLKNPISYNQTLGHKFYEHKLKRFLSEIALGMMPNTLWSGLYDGTEGYLVIKEDGELICYHIINRNLFEDYLLANTRMETPSSTRHGFGTLFTKNNELYIKLNLQIRFI